MAAELRNMPDLRAMVHEACQALVRLDAEQLEQMAIECCRLQLPEDPTIEDGAALRRYARNAAPEMAVFARVLAATRENLQVMRRLQSLRQGRLDSYGPGANDGNH
jgi:hypothetical protein